MVTTTYRTTTTASTLLQNSGSTITNVGRISPPLNRSPPIPSAEEYDDEYNEAPEVEVGQDLHLPLFTPTSSTTRPTVDNINMTEPPVAMVLATNRNVATNGNHHSVPPPRAISNGTVMSALTIESSADANEYGDYNNSTAPPPPPPPLLGRMPMPPPRSFANQGTATATAKDISSNTTNSRSSLQLQILKRKNSLTVQEQKYLDALVVHGKEIQVELALEKLKDDELFFEHDGPTHTVVWGKGAAEGVGGLVEEKSSSAGAGCGDSVASTGSQRRLQALEKRKNSIQHLTLWRAHESGLAVTRQGSRCSIQRRRSSVGSSNSSGIPRPPPSAGDIFRQHHQQSKQMIPKPFGFKNPKLHQRSQSLLIPAMPARNSVQRRSSSSSKSVTFHQETDGIAKPKQKKLLRRSVSDTNAVCLATVDDDDDDDDATAVAAVLSQQEPTSYIPSIHHAHPIRQDSVSSIPSLHHGHLIREESIASIPSLHHGHLIREESISSIPSLHHGHLIREESISSIPSLHHGHMIREESTTSTPSLHHGHLIREESISSIPSLHHGHFIREESVGRIPSLHHGHPLLDDGSSPAEAVAPTRNSVALQFSASADIANAWLQQQEQEPSQPSRVSEANVEALPHALTIPSNTTDETSSSTVGTATTVASSYYANLEFDQDDEDEKRQLEVTSTTHATSSPSKPVLMRLASRNAYDGEGIEVTEFQDGSLDDNYAYTSSTTSTFPGMVSMDVSIRTCNSWDTAMSSYQPHPEIFRGVSRRSLSDDDMVPLFLGSGANLLFKDSSNTYHMNGRQISSYREPDEDDCSWDMNSESEAPRHDSWNVLKDDYVNGYGGGNSLDFRILGTNADDEASLPHVLSPPLMESLQAFLPITKSGQNFYLKYSLVRDGASLHTFLKRARGVQYSILALETVDGEVFGCFTAMPWRKNWNYFGSGESFLWRMRRSRLEKTHDILEQAHLESEIDVFPYTGENRFIQLCTHDRIAVGGGTPSEKKWDGNGLMMAPGEGSDDLIQPHEWGFGLAIDEDMFTGTTSPCVTFGSPSLSKVHSNGTVFEVVNMELWTLTPCMNVEDAEKLELGKLFLER